MAAALVGVFTAGSGSTAGVTTSSRTTTSGTMITGSDSNFRATTVSTSVLFTDSNTGTWATDVENSQGDKTRTTLGYTLPSSGSRGAGQTVTGTLTGGTGTIEHAVGAQEWSGIATTPTTTSHTATGTGTDATDSVTTGAESLVVMVATYSGGSTTYAAGANTTEAQEAGGGGTVSHSANYNLSVNGTLALHSTLGASRNWGTCIMGWTVDTGGGGRTTKNTRAFPLGMAIGMHRVGNGDCS